MIIDSASSGATTDPQVLEPLLILLRDTFPNSEIFLLENDASGNQVDTLFSLLKINELAQKYQCEVLNVANDTWKKVDINGTLFKQIEIPNIIDTCDILINHPKLKTHGITKISVSLKNMFGFIKEKYKFKYHFKLDDAIVDINRAIKSNYCIVDGNIALEGIEGPTYGYPKKCNFLIGGSNVVTTDAFCSYLMGFHPWFVPHIRKAHYSGLGDMHFIDHNLCLSELRYSDYKFDFDLIQYNMLKLLRGVI